jgi:hypothetical protein
MVSILVRKAQSFIRLSRFEKACLLPAWLLLATSRLVILALPFRHLAPWLGSPAGVAAWIPLVSHGSESTASAIARVVRIAAACTPWESNCMPRALTARALLGFCGIPCTVFFGVARDSTETKLDAHAWVAAGRVPVTGGVSFDRFAVVGCFVARKLPHPGSHAQ